MAERPTPELPMPVTCLYASPYTRYSILHTLVFHLYTFAQAEGRFARLHLSIGAYT